jgi:hypothetical protein
MIKTIKLLVVYFSFFGFLFLWYKFFSVLFGQLTPVMWAVLGIAAVLGAWLIQKGRIKKPKESAPVKVYNEVIGEVFWLLIKLAVVSVTLGFLAGLGTYGLGAMIGVWAGILCLVLAGVFAFLLLLPILIRWLVTFARLVSKKAKKNRGR